MCCFYSLFMILRKGTDKPFQKARWGIRASSHHVQSRQHRVREPALTWARFSLPRPSVGLNQHPHGLSLLMNYLCILIPGSTHLSPSRGHLHAARAGAACPDATLQQCPAVPGNSRRKGSAWAAPPCPLGPANRGDLVTPPSLRHHPCPLLAPALPRGSRCSQLRHGTHEPGSHLGTCHLGSHHSMGHPWSHLRPCQPGSHLGTCLPWSHPVPAVGSAARLGCKRRALPGWANPQHRLAPQTPFQLPLS